MYGQVATDACLISYRNCLNQCLDDENCMKACDQALRSCVQGRTGKPPAGGLSDIPVWAWILIGVGILMLFMLMMSPTRG